MSGGCGGGGGWSSFKQSMSRMSASRISFSCMFVCMSSVLGGGARLGGWGEEGEEGEGSLGVSKDDVEAFFLPLFLLVFSLVTRGPQFSRLSGPPPPPPPASTTSTLPILLLLLLGVAVMEVLWGEGGVEEEEEKEEEEEEREGEAEDEEG